MTEPTAIADVIIKGAALVGTAVFFGYKTVSGFHNQNLSLALNCQRHAGNGAAGPDYLILTVGIERGATAAMRLEVLEARFTWESGGSRQQEVIRIPFRRLAIGPSEEVFSQVKWDETDANHPYLYLSPGEKTSFACAVSVPANALCTIDVVAVGRRRPTTFSAQWRASTIAAPR